jgi:hypothetical protein
MGSVDNSWKFRLYLEENSEQQKGLKTRPTQDKSEPFMRIQYGKHGQEIIYMHKTYILCTWTKCMCQCLNIRGQLFWP